MGMDAKANVFYGYKQDVICQDDEGDYIPMPDEINIVRQFDSHYMAVKQTNQRFDWDYGIQDLKLETIQNPDLATWKAILRKGCDALGLDFKEEYCGWFVVCDYR